jgi:hypothetical protein
MFNKRFFKNNKGFLSLFEILTGFLIIILALISFNIGVNMYIPTNSEEIVDYNEAQDIMELMSSKIDINQQSFLEKIKQKLESDSYFEDSLDEISFMSGTFLNETTDKNYLLLENNQLNGTVLAVNGDFNSAENIASSIRNIGNYSFSLYIW